MNNFRSSVYSMICLIFFTHKIVETLYFWLISRFSSKAVACWLKVFLAKYKIICINNSQEGENFRLEEVAWKEMQFTHHLQCKILSLKIIASHDNIRSSFYQIFVLLKSLAKRLSNFGISWHFWYCLTCIDIV